MKKPALNYRAIIRTQISGEYASKALSIILLSELVKPLGLHCAVCAMEPFKLVMYFLQLKPFNYLS